MVFRSGRVTTARPEFTSGLAVARRAVRVSIGPFTDEDQMDQLLTALREIAVEASV